MPNVQTECLNVVIVIFSDRDNLCFYFKNGKRGRTLVFSASGDICPGFQSWGGCLVHVLHPLRGFIRFTSRTTSAYLLASSMAAQLFDPHTATRVQALLGLEPGIAVCRTVYYALTL